MSIKHYNYKKNDIHFLYNYFIRHITNSSTVLEIGSACGILTHYLTTEKGCKVTCIEIDPEGAEMCSKIAHKVILANVEDDDWMEKLSGETFDFIVMGDVLEHLHNPGKVLFKIKPFLSSKGLLLTSIPNLTHSAIMLSLIKGRFDYQDTGLLDRTHIHFFTRRSVAKIFNEAGWHCVKEKASAVLPVNSGLPYSYISLPFWAPLLACLRDAHTFQFKQSWVINPSPEQPEINILAFKRGRRPLALIEMMGDMAIFLYKKIASTLNPHK